MPVHRGHRRGVTLPIRMPACSRRWAAPLARSIVSARGSQGRRSCPGLGLCTRATRPPSPVSCLPSSGTGLPSSVVCIRYRPACGPTPHTGCFGAASECSPAPNSSELTDVPRRPPKTAGSVRPKTAGHMPARRRRRAPGGEDAALARRKSAKLFVSWGGDRRRRSGVRFYPVAFSESGRRGPTGTWPCGLPRRRHWRWFCRVLGNVVWFAPLLVRHPRAWPPARLRHPRPRLPLRGSSAIVVCRLLLCRGVWPRRSRSAPLRVGPCRDPGGRARPVARGPA